MIVILQNTYNKFLSTQFQKESHFSTYYIGPAEFLEAYYIGPAEFSEAYYIGPAEFSEAHYIGPAEFSEAYYIGPAELLEAYYIFLNFSCLCRFLISRPSNSFQQKPEVKL